MDNIKNAFALIGVGLVIGIFIAIILVFVVGAKPTGVNIGPINFEFPTATTISTTPTFAVLPPTNQSVMPSTSNNINCSFANELSQKADILQWIDNPTGSNKWAGLQIRVTSLLDVPEGWIVQRGAGDEYAPITLQAGNVVSIYSPESCRPLTKPTVATGFDCSFIDVLRANTDVLQLLYIPSGSDTLVGAQVRFVSEIEIPTGWIVQQGAGDEFGPITLPVGTVASVYSPESCRPLK